jgi:peroxiredoxin
MKALLLTLVLAGAPLHSAAPRSQAEACRPYVGAPGFVDAKGRNVSLREVGAGRPLAVAVIKGEWCPACRTQLEAISAKAEDVRAAGGAVIGLSTEDSGTNRKLAKELGLRFDVLGEPEAKLLKQLGFWLPEDGHPLPGVLFLDACGDVATAIVGRQPGVDQTRVILETLDRLARQPTRCGKS